MNDLFLQLTSSDGRAVCFARESEVIIVDRVYEEQRYSYHCAITVHLI